MYALVDGLCFMAGIAGFVLSFVYQKPYYCPIAVVWIATYPLLNQVVYNIVAKCCAKRVIYQMGFNSRIVYHPGYNLSFCGIQRLHPFDSQKYRHVYQKIIEMGIVNQSTIIQPNIISRGLLLQKMSLTYLLKLNYAICVSSYIQMPLCFLPAFLLRWRVLNPMMLGTQGTILACLAAFKMKWAINLSGGYHHASFDRGGGFCVYPDISLAAHYLQSRLGLQRIMIIDLDAHQGNGHERDHIKRQDIYIVDAYNHNIYPGDTQSKQAISMDISVSYSTKNQEYIRSISKIQQAIDNFRPQFVIYNAGTDCLIGDPLGNLSITEDGVILRDETIFRICLKNHVPIAMVMSGGYQKINAQVIAKSIKNLYQKFQSTYN